MNNKKVEVNAKDGEFAQLLGDRLRVLRGRESQASFAAKLGVSGNTYAYYERGERIPGADTIRRVAEVTGRDASELLGLPSLAANSNAIEALKLVGQTGHPLPDDMVLFAECVQTLCQMDAFRNSPIKGITLMARGIYETCRETGKKPIEIAGEYLPS